MPRVERSHDVTTGTCAGVDRRLLRAALSRIAARVCVLAVLCCFLTGVMGTCFGEMGGGSSGVDTCSPSSVRL